jgi:hypothetical protein
VQDCERQQVSSSKKFMKELETMRQQVIGFVAAWDSRFWKPEISLSDCITKMLFEFSSEFQIVLSCCFLSGGPAVRTVVSQSNDLPWSFIPF